jgi:hypothetical protein
MKLDNRNPFAAWGFEEEKYGVAVDEANGINEYTEDVKGFVNETVVDEAYNKVAEPISAEEYSEQHTDQMSFFTNNENMLPTSLANKAYGNDQELQREYPAGESLNYYGNEADDLKLYGEGEEETDGGDQTPDDGGDDTTVTEPDSDTEQTPETEPENGDNVDDEI